jgi:hypothetical protein
MKPILLLSVCAVLLGVSRSLASVNADSAANYSGGWTNGSTGGGGFGAWNITATSGAGLATNGVWASSNAGLSMGNAFGFTALGSGSSIVLDRPFSQVMTNGDVFTFDLGLNYSSGADGNRGFTLRTADNRDVITVNQGSSDSITINGTVALTNYGMDTMHWTFTQSSPTQVVVYATGRSGSEAYSAALKTTVTNFLAGIRFYATNQSNDEYADYRAVYFDNLILSQIAGTNTFTYSVEDGRTIITGIASNTAGAVVIPASLGGYTVTEIGRAAFKDRTNLTSITFASGASVTNIGCSAFDGCTGLLLAVLPTGLTSISPGLFYGCGKLISVTVPTGVTNIGEGAFAGCASLSSVALPARLKTVGESALLNCRALIGLDLPDTLPAIPGQLCYDCRALEALELPAAITNIGYGAFYNCGGLASLSVPSTVKTIEHDAFRACDGLTSLTLNCPLKSLGDLAFYGCSSLQTIYFYGGLTSLGAGVFGGCDFLTGVYFLGNTPSLGSDAGADVFAASGDLTVYYLGATTSWASTFCGAPVEPWLPQIISPIGTASTFGFNVEWATGYTVRVQACTNLASPAWVNLGTNTISGGLCSFTDTNRATFPQRFYRVCSAN